MLRRAKTSARLLLVMTKTAEKTKESTISAMFEAGAHYGHMKARRHPSARKFVYGSKNRVEIFDLEQTADALTVAKEAMKKLGKEKAVVLFLGGKNEAHAAIKKAGADLSMPFVASRWVGGTLTNFDLIKSRYDKLVNLKNQKDKGELAKYTKWEQMRIAKDIARLEKNFGGLVGLAKLPKAMVLIDSKREHNAMREAIVSGMQTISVCSSDCNLEEVTHAIPANDASRASINFFVNELVLAYKEGLQEA